MDTGIQIGGAAVSVGERVVYPNGGICRVKGVESKQIAGREWRMLMLQREEDQATVMVPQEKVESIGLRKVANPDAIAVLFEYFTHSNTDPELDWKIRHRENFEKMAAGGLLDTAQVLKGLHALAQIRPLPQKEREMYDSARHQLVGEIAAALSIPAAVAENNIDYALTPPPGSGRTAPKDQPLDLKALRRSLGGAKRAGGLEFEEEEEEEELGLGDEGEEAEGEEEAEEAPQAGNEDEEEGEEEAPRPAKAKAPKAEKPKAEKAPKKPKAAKAPKVEEAEEGEEEEPFAPAPRAAMPKIPSIADMPPPMREPEPVRAAPEPKPMPPPPPRAEPKVEAVAEPKPAPKVEAKPEPKPAPAVKAVAPVKEKELPAEEPKKAPAKKPAAKKAAAKKEEKEEKPVKAKTAKSAAKAPKAAKAAPKAAAKKPAAKAAAKAPAKKGAKK